MPTRDLLQLLKEHGVEEHFDVLTENRVDLDILPEITGEDLRELGIPLGDRKRILHLAETIADPEEPAAPSHRQPVPEIRQISVLFADLAGSTPMAEALDIEDYHAALESFHACCTGIVRDEDGFSARFVGDAVLACFGYPNASEDDAIRAARAGLRIVERVPLLDTATGNPLHARVGIATGMAMTGDLVADSAKAFGPATGATLNLAARLQSFAAADTVVVDAETQRLLRGIFTSESLGEHILKGFDEPKTLWRIGMVDRDARSDAQRSNETALIGRSDELDLLASRLAAAPRKGSVGLLIGEAGIGKSRLVSEFVARSKTENPDRTVLPMECSASETLRPLHPVISGIEAISGVARLDDPAERVSRLRKWVADDLKLSPRTATILGNLLSLGDSEEEAFGDTRPSERRATLFRTLIQVFERLSLDTPLIAVLEDMHWIDPTTEELLDHLIESVTSLRILLICTTRPDYTPAFIGKPRVFVVSLSRLEQDEVIAMMRSVAGAGALPPDIAEEIANRTEGVPLFVEELTKSVLESRERGQIPAGDTAEPSRPLPTTLLGSLLARLDRVENSGRIAPIGAAIGRSFARSLVIPVSGLDDAEAKTILRDLVSSGLLSKHGRGAEAVYTFKHALVQDAAYETLPKSRRIAIHTAIVETLARAPAATRPEVMARHWFAAQDYPKACECWLAAAKTAHRASAHEEAIAYIHTALDANKRTQSDDLRRDREIALREALYVPLQVQNWGSSEIEKNMARLRQLRAERGDVEELLDILHAQSGYNIIQGRIADARKLALEILDKYGDLDTGRALGLRCLGFCSFLAGDFDAAIAELEETATVASQVERDRLARFYQADTVLVAQAMTCWALTLNDEHGAALEKIGAVLPEVRASDDKWTRVYAETVIASAFQVLGDAETCSTIVQEAIETARDVEAAYWIAWGQVLQGWSLAMRGEPSLGIIEIKSGIAAYRATGSCQMLPYALTMLAQAEAEAGGHDRVRKIIDELDKHREPVEVRYVDGMLAELSRRLPPPGG